MQRGQYNAAVRLLHKPDMHLMERNQFWNSQDPQRDLGGQEATEQILWRGRRVPVWDWCSVQAFL